MRVPASREPIATGYLTDNVALDRSDRNGSGRTPLSSPQDKAERLHLKVDTTVRRERGCHAALKGLRYDDTVRYDVTLTVVGQPF